MARLVPAINAHAQPIRIGYGFSMGAYGALKNGRLLDLTHVLALSPVNYALTSADIRKIVWDRSFCPELNDGPLLACQELAPINLQVLDPFFRWIGSRANYLLRQGEFEQSERHLPNTLQWDLFAERIIFRPR